MLRPSHEAAAAFGSPTFDQVKLTAKSVMALVACSNELLSDAPNSADLIQYILTQALAHEIDRVIMFGTGASGQPTGIAGTSGINTISMGTNGAAITGYSQLLDALKLNALANADNSKAVAVMNPAIKQEFDGSLTLSATR